MTREENLHWLNKEIETWENECQSKHPIKEALYAARKALEQEPCEDAVSRDDVVRIVQHNNPPKALEKIRKLSSVTPQEPRKGHWIKEESPFGWDRHSYQCSECSRSIHLDTEMEDLEDYPYCHCGAKMQEIEE